MTEKKTKESSRRQERSSSTALATPGFGLSQLFEELTKPFEEFMGPTSSLWTEFGSQPSTDIQDRGDHFVLTAQLPGFDKKDIEVQVTSDAVELKAEKQTEKTEEKKIHRSHSYFHRYITLPEQVRSGKVDGSMKNGVLEVKLPKLEPSNKGSSARRVHLN